MKRLDAFGGPPSIHATSRRTFLVSSRAASASGRRLRSLRVEGSVPSKVVVLALEDRPGGHFNVAVGGSPARHAEPHHRPALVPRRRDPAPAVALRRGRHGRGYVVIAETNQRLVEHDRVDERRAASLQK